MRNHDIMRIYTKKGDSGMTDLADRTRVPKSDARVMAYGAVDEANASIGIALAHMQKGPRSDALLGVQADLFVVGSELARMPADSGVSVSSEMVNELERVIDECDAELEPLANFVLPGGGVAGAHIHAARATIRRAETLAVSLGRDAVRAECLSYLNRVSDLLFVMARCVNADEQVSEQTWSRKDTL